MSPVEENMLLPIGYNGVDLGITNQKIAFIGLVHKAFREKRPLYCPPLVVYDLATGLRKRVGFFEVFEQNPLMEVLESFNIKVLFSENDLYEAVDGWQCFLEGADRFGEIQRLGDVALDDLTCSIVRAFALKKSYLKIVRSIEDKLHDLDVNCVIQMRIEKDWEGYSTNVLNSISSENNLPTANEILQRVNRKFNSTVKAAFILCDEDAMPLSKDEIREIALKNYGIKLFWKSDFIDIKAYTPLILSLIDFEIGMLSKIFIGTSRSTFSCFVSFEKYCKQREMVKNHYIYNCDSNDIRERCDNGTAVDAKNALAKTWVRPNLLSDVYNNLEFPMVLSAHVSNLGEYISRTSIVRGLVNSKLVAGDCSNQNIHHIEGFMISVPESVPRLKYKTWDIFGNEGKWFNDGSYSGSKGQSLPLSAFAIKIEGPASLALDCVYAAVFSDQDDIVLASNGSECRSVSGKGKLLCMQVAIRRKI